MFCPICGKEASSEYDKFCSNCGSRFDFGIAINTYTPPIPTQKKSNGVKFAAVAVIAILLAVAILGVMGSSLLDDNKSSERESVHVYIDEKSYFNLYDDFIPDKDIFIVSFNNEGQIVFDLNAEIAAEYDTFDWKFVDTNHTYYTGDYWYVKYVGETLHKTEPKLTYLIPVPGEFDISVECRNADGRVQIYAGSVDYCGTITKDYTWPYKSSQYSVSISFSLEDYIKYKEKDANRRNVTNYNRTKDFVTFDDPTVKVLAEKLKGAYTGNTQTGDVGFANFILGFVQYCYDYPPYTSTLVADKYQYGVDEYFAYPLETIFYGMGDCEDTAILAAALYTALGYDAAIGLVPSHAMVGVALENYNVTNTQPSSYDIISQVIGDSTYYAGETTIEKMTRDLGIIDKQGMFDSYSKYFDGSESSRYGFYLVTSS